MKKVFTYVKELGLIKPGEHILAGVSGGADSVCLFYLLLELKEQLDFSFSVITVEHGIRGEESLRDAEFVKRLCEKRGIPFIMRRVQVPRLVEEKKLSEEEAARQLRYQAFFEEAERIGADKIAVAHHADDVMETMLFFLCRGTGMAGLNPMKPVSGKIIRPLLNVTREEIQDYLQEKGISWCLDATNEDVNYTRNRIRKQVVPVLKAVNPEAALHFSRTARWIGQAQEVLEKEEERGFKEHVLVGEDRILIKKSLLTELPYVVNRVILKAITKAAGRSKDIAGVHVEAVAELLEKQVGSRRNLPYGVLAETGYEGVFIKKAVETGTEIVFSQELFVPGEAILPDGSVFCAQIIEKNERNSEIPRKTCTKWMDYDIIENTLVVRTWQPEDYFIVDEAGHRKSVKKFLTDEKVPREKRVGQLVLAEGNHVYWILGSRMAEDVKVTGKTRRILEVRLYNK